MQFINHNLKFYRESQRYTQQEIADKLKTTVGRVKSYERNSAIPQIEMIIKIAAMMQISIDALIKIKLNDKNYLNQKGETPELIKRVEAIEKKLSRH